MDLIGFVLREQMMKEFLLLAEKVGYVPPKLDETDLTALLEGFDPEIKNYLLSALFNAPTTMGSYYQSEVSHDQACRAM